MTAFFPGDYFFIRPPNAPQNSWVFLASSSMKRSARCMYRCARSSWAGVIRTGSGAGAVCGGSAFGGCRHTFRFGLVLASGGAASSLGGRLAHSSRRRRRRRLWGRLHRRWSRLSWLRWRWLRGLWFGHRVNIFLHFFFRKILVFVVQKNRKGNAGAAGVYHIAVYVCEFEAQIAQSNRAV